MIRWVYREPPNPADRILRPLDVKSGLETQAAVDAMPVGNSERHAIAVKPKRQIIPFVLRIPPVTASDLQGVLFEQAKRQDAKKCHDEQDGKCTKYQR